MDDSKDAGDESAPEGSTTAEERTRAFQFDMLQVDVDYAQQWIVTMAALVDQELEHEPFTERRMAALHDWEAKRKSDQAKLRYRYDPKRRPARLIDTTTREGRREARDDLKARMQDLADRGVTRTPWKQSKGRKIMDQMEREAKAAIAAEDALPPVPTKPKTAAQSAGLFIAEISNLSGVSDLLTTGDAQIRAGLRRSGMDPTTINRTMVNLRNAIYVNTGQRRPLIDDGF
jgi:hypothetical protein